MRDNTKALLEGRVPEDVRLLDRVTVGIDPLIDFLTKQYPEEFISKGGSKLKFITGRKGSGKSHLSRLLLARAAERGFVTVRFSAKEVWLHDFREIYLEVLRRCGIDAILKSCADGVVREMDYDPEQIRPGQKFLDFLAERKEADAISKSTIRSALRARFTQNPLMDNCFASCCSLLTGDLLGYPSLDAASGDAVLRCLFGDKSVKFSQLRALGISPARITKFNSRHMLRSLSELIHQSGRAGLVVVIDDMDTLLNANVNDPIRYTKMRREDAYESIRQLIDDIDSMQYLFWICCFDRSLIDDETAGLRSYQALWMRIQNEVVGSRFNSFADMLDLDRLADTVYTPETLCEMSRRLAQALREDGSDARQLTGQEAADLTERALYGGIGLPLLVNRAVVGTIGEEDGEHV